MAAANELVIRAALREEREFVLTLGGYALQIAGAALVTHERVPVPAFNFVQDLAVSPGRRAAFFERALDHYFQRALRPTIRAASPVPADTRSALTRLGFHPRPQSWTLLLADRPAPPTEAGVPSEFRVRRAEPGELDDVARFWVAPEDGTEFRRALEVAWNSPNPGERLVPVLAFSRSRPVAAAILHEFGSTLGIHAVATEPASRGRGAATGIVAHALAHELAEETLQIAIGDGSGRLERRLAPLGFHAARHWTVFELPEGAELALPSPGPPQPPRWRPPRSGPGR